MNGVVHSNCKTVAEQAAKWIVLMDEGKISPLHKSQLLNWLKQSPVHIDEFLLASAMWSELNGLQTAAREDIDKLIQQARENVLRMPDRPTELKLDRTLPLGRKKFKALFAAAATILVLAGLYFGLPWNENHFVTNVGEQLTFILHDGTVIHLNTESELVAEITTKTREIKLLQGEAMFNVAKDPNRPFKVKSGAVVVQALGTQFNVYRYNSMTNVTVVEGKVSVLPEHETNSLPTRPGTLNPVFAEETVYVAGQQAIGYQDGHIARVDKPDIEKSVAWRERRLVFRGDRLDSIAQEFNRYNRRKLEIRNDVLKSRILTATFDADDPASLVSFLERDQDIEVVYQSQLILIQLKEPRSES